MEHISSQVDTPMCERTDIQFKGISNPVMSIANSNCLTQTTDVCFGLQTATTILATGAERNCTETLRTTTAIYGGYPNPNGSGNTQTHPAQNNIFQFAQPRMVIPTTQVPVTTVTSNMQDSMMNLLMSMNQKLSTIQDDVRTLKSDRSEVNEQLAGLKYDQEDDHEEIVSHRKEINTCHDQLDTLTNLVIGYEQHICSLNRKCLNLEAKGMRSELLIFGLEENKSVSGTETAKKFFTEKMEMTTPPTIKHAYWKGKGQYKPLLVKLSNQAQKGLIYTNSKNLKGKKNKNDTPYRVTDNLPEELAEEQMRNRQILAANKVLGEAEKLPMSMKKGKLMIGNETYRKKVEIPSARQLLDFNEDMINAVQSLKVAESKDITEMGSRFRVYAFKTTTLEQVRTGLHHIKRKFSDASHTIMAYRLAGLNKAYNEDYLDNREHGMGRRMLQQLIQRDEVNITTIAIRYFNGQHIGPKRFQIVKDLIEEACTNLEQDITFNSVLPLRCLLPVKGSNRGKHQQRRQNATAPIRGGHSNHNRFDSLAYNQYTMNTRTDDEDFTQ